MLKQMDPLKHMRECGKHEKRVSETDMLRICETCGRHFYVCDLCRKAKGIDAPLSICKLKIIVLSKPLFVSFCLYQVHILFR